MKILVAEDEAVSRHALTRTLTKWGYEVVVARDGWEAWEVLQRDDAPLLAILDWMMPGMDGVEVCQRVRQASAAPYVYMLMLTAKANKQDIIHAMEAGADDYVCKPFDEQELHVRLRAGRRTVELQEALRRQATHDALTGVWNRLTIFEFLQKALDRATRDRTEVSIIMVDFDHFKQINDTHGHLAGDAVLCEAVSRIRLSLRTHDALGRYGGEEFLVVLPGCGVAQALDVAERVRGQIVATAVETASGMIPVTASLGVAGTSTRYEIDVDGLMHAADDALYRAKRSGRNRVELTVCGAEQEACTTAEQVFVP